MLSCSVFSDESSSDDSANVILSSNSQLLNASSPIIKHSLEKSKSPVIPEFANEQSPIASIFIETSGSIEKLSEQSSKALLITCLRLYPSGTRISPFISWVAFMRYAVSSAFKPYNNVPCVSAETNVYSSPAVQIFDTPLSIWISQDEFTYIERLLGVFESSTSRTEALNAATIPSGNGFIPKLTVPFDLARIISRFLQFLNALLPISVIESGSSKT